MLLFTKGKKPIDTPEEIRKETLKKRNNRLKKMYTQREINFLYDVEDAWYDYAADEDEKDFYRLFELLKKRIRWQAYQWEKNYRDKLRLSQSDFESIFWETAWKVCEKYDELPYDFMLFEYIRKAMESRAIDLLRKESSRQWEFEHNVKSFEKEFEEKEYADIINIEREISDKLFIYQMINDDALTDKEKEVLKAMYYNLTLSYRDLATHTGYNHPEQVRRTIKRIDKTLSRYKEDY